MIDQEAFGGLDVFQVDPAEAWLHHRDRLDQRVGIFAIELNVDRIDVGEALEQHRLAFHHRLRGERAKIAHAQDRGAVGDYRDQVALGGILIGIGGIVIDRLDRNRDTGRVSEAKVALGRHRFAGDDLDLTGPDGLVIEQRLALGEADVGFFAVRAVFGHRFLLKSPPVLTQPCATR
jgi:hypothetical protein